jgi:hypothetical protein
VFVWGLDVDDPVVRMDVQPIEAAVDAVVDEQAVGQVLFEPWRSYPRSRRNTHLMAVDEDRDVHVDVVLDLLLNRGPAGDAADRCPCAIVSADARSGTFWTATPSGPDDPAEESLPERPKPRPRPRPRRTTASTTSTAFLRPPL